MTDIDKAVRLYTLMADRLEASGHAPRQARIYREQADLIRGCQTLEEATEKIKNSPYYLGAGAALLQDKLAALAQASEAVGMPDVAQVYWDKIRAIEDDVAAMYEAGYETRAANLKRPYLETFEAFASLYRTYLTLSGQSALDSTGRESMLKDLREALGRLRKPSDSFEELAGLPAFRKLVEADDAAYESFVQEVPQLAAHGPDLALTLEAIKADWKQTLAGLRSQQGPVKAAGQANQGRVRRAQALAKAPSSRQGTYQFSQEEVKPFV